MRLVTFTESIWRSDISIFNIFLAYFVKYLKTGEWRRILEHSLWFLLPQQIQNNFKICQKSIRKKRQKRLFGQRVFYQWSNIASIMLSFCHTKYSLYNIWHKNIPFTIFETKKVQVYFIYFCSYNVWLFCLRHKRKWNRTKSRPKNVCYL